MRLNTLKIKDNTVKSFTTGNENGPRNKEKRINM